MSLVDALLLIASTDRAIRFLIFKDIYDLPYIKPFAKMIRAIPISSQLRPRDMIHSLREASDAIRAAKSSASSPKARSRASASCSPSAAAWNAS